MAERCQWFSIAMVYLFPQDLKDMGSSFIVQHGELSVHCQMNTLLGLFLFSMAEKGRTGANRKTASRPEGSFSLALTWSNCTGSISSLSVNTLRAPHQLWAFRAGKRMHALGAHHLIWEDLLCYAPWKEVKCQTEQRLPFISRARTATWWKWHTQRMALRRSK